MGLTVVKGTGGRVGWTDYSGGVVLNDSLELAANQFPAGLNVTTQYDGAALAARFGGAQLTSAMPDDGTGAAAKILACDGDSILVEKGTKLYVYTVVTNTWTTVTSGGAFTITANNGGCAAPFMGEYVYSNLANGTYTISAGSATLRDATVKGCCMTVWQTKVYVGGATGSGGNNRVYWCNALNSHTWTTGTDFIDIVEGVGSIVAMRLTDSMDYQGRPGFLLAKPQGVFRMNSPTTGAYTTLSTSIGAAGAWAMCPLEGWMYILNFVGNELRGIFRTDGGSPPVRISQAIDPMFQRQPGFPYSNAPTNTADWAAAAGGRVYFSLTAIGDGYLAELDPRTGGWFIHKTGVKYHTPMVSPELVDSGAAIVDGLLVTRKDANSNRVFVAFAPTGGYSSGTDVDTSGASTTFAASVRTGWREPNGGRRVRPQRLFFRGRASLNNVTVGIRRDYASTVATGFTLTAAVPLNTSIPVGSVPVCKAAAIDLSWTSAAAIGVFVDDTAVTSNRTGFQVQSVDLEYANLGF